MSLTILTLFAACGFGVNLDHDEDNDDVVFDQDCDDARAAIFPGAEEIRHDGIDQNCNGMDDEDEDGDGQTVKESDCDDEAPYVFSGAVEWRDESDNDCDGEVDEDNILDEFVLWQTTHEYTSTMLSTMGVDVSGDGRSEIFVGETEGRGDQARSGVVHVLSRDAAEGIRAQAVGGLDEDDRFGSALAAGDLDGDGTIAVAVGAAGSDAGGTASGAVEVLSAEAMVAGMPDATYALWYGTAFSYAGSSLAFVAGGDNAGAELLVGAYGSDDGAGTVYRLDDESLAEGDGDLAGRAVGVLSGEGADDRFGWALTGGADWDGDGLEDFAVGAPQSSQAAAMSGAVYLYPHEAGRESVDPVAVLIGEAAYDNAGYALASGGDVDGDGYADLIVGAPGNDDSGSDAGRVYVVRGGGGNQARTLAETPVHISGSTQAMQLGLTVALAGDLDADGSAEVVLGGLADEDLGGLAASYVYRGDELTSSMTTGQADAVFVSDQKNLALVANGIGSWDGAFYDSVPSYADLAVVAADSETQQTSVYLILGHATQP